METTWTEKAQTVHAETREALQTVYDSLNNGQQNKLLKDETVKALLDKYGVVTE